MSHYLLTINSGKLQLTTISTSSSTLLRSAVLPLTLTEMPSNELHRKSFTPEEVLPHLRVAQTGPRVPRNTNRGSSRVLTNSPEIAKLKEAHNAKVLKEHNRILRENKKLSKVQKENNKKVRFT
ncbi:Uncharacterized protein APZ42_009431 [Daphnia magna]|uniref:Uncharacterized protein n=1 Tax=Daphnia magna TaxID=35525 RepID=A0A164E0P6_9CRUS|nr:Uncharacterized protein APZ42_009431 [Daphnia magna]